MATESFDRWTTLLPYGGCAAEEAEVEHGVDVAEVDAHSPARSPLPQRGAFH